MNELKKHNAEDIIVVCGGVIPKKDYKFLYDCGVAAIFGPGTSIPEAAETIINKTTNHLKRMHNYRKSRIKNRKFNLKMKYKSVYNQWKNDPDKILAKFAKDIVWNLFPKTIFK